MHTHTHTHTWMKVNVMYSITAISGCGLGRRPHPLTSHRCIPFSGQDAVVQGVLSESWGAKTPPVHLTEPSPESPVPVWPPYGTHLEGREVKERRGDQHRCGRRRGGGKDACVYVYSS